MIWQCHEWPILAASYKRVYSWNFAVNYSLTKLLKFHEPSGQNAAFSHDCPLLWPATELGPVPLTAVVSCKHGVEAAECMYTV